LTGRPQQHGFGAGHQMGHGGIGGQHGPVAIHRQGGIRCVRRKQDLDVAANDIQCRRVEGMLAERRGKAGGLQQGVLIAQRHLQARRQIEQHSPAWPDPPGLKKTQVFRGNFSVTRQIALAHASLGPPFA
jgi:hypothetical protein